MEHDLEKKEKTACIRLSDTQMKMIEHIKAGNPRLTNTDMMMAGINLLDYLEKKRKNEDRSYEELLNALMIRDDLLRGLNRQENTMVDNDKRKRELDLSLKDNEEKIDLFLKILA